MAAAASAQILLWSSMGSNSGFETGFKLEQGHLSGFYRSSFL